jgi:hypothetical protein
MNLNLSAFSYILHAYYLKFYFEAYFVTKKRIVPTLYYSIILLLSIKLGVNPNFLSKPNSRSKS